LSIRFLSEVLLPLLREDEHTIDGGIHSSRIPTEEKLFARKGIHFFGAGVFWRCLKEHEKSKCLCLEEIRAQSRTTLFEAVAANIKGEPSCAYLVDQNLPEICKWCIMDRIWFDALTSEI